MEDPASYVVHPQPQPLAGVPLTGRSRFVQQADVDAAAFAILKERTRPTVEKVRARLGRGSPNTIGPLLEKWFAQLADRLEGASAAGSALDLPAAVANGARLLWHTAIGEARAQAARELAGEREKLEGERTQLGAERAQVQEEGRVLAATRAALEEGMRLAQEQAAELRAVLEDRTQKLSQADARVRSLTSALEEAQAATAAAHASARKQLAEQSARHEEERRREAERAASTERHLMSELDRARQDAKAAREDTRKSEELHAAEARAAADRLKELQARHDEQARALAEAKELALRSEATLQQAREAESAARALHASVQSRIEDLTKTLASEREAAVTLRDQLTAALQRPTAAPRQSDARKGERR